MFHDAAQVSFVSSLEQNWEGIYREYLGVRMSLIDWSERELYGKGWKVFGLFDFPHGIAIAENVAKCRLTAELIEGHVPHHGAAGFSVLKPGTRIQPHVGYQGSFLRCHLGLSIPDGDCGLTVAGETRRWQPGKAMVFDDRNEHSAWNLTSEERVVLLVDFVPLQPIARA
jgi:beta-hydroxylase